MKIVQPDVIQRVLIDIFNKNGYNTLLDVFEEFSTEELSGDIYDFFQKYGFINDETSESDIAILKNIGSFKETIGVLADRKAIVSNNIYSASIFLELIDQNIIFDDSLNIVTQLPIAVFSVIDENKKDEKLIVNFQQFINEKNRVFVKITENKQTIEDLAVGGRFDRLKSDYANIAKEPVELKIMGNDIYAFGSELACLRLYNHFTKNHYTDSNYFTKVEYSKNINSWYFLNSKKS